ncbi:MAG: hypothetical protein ACOCUU_01380 [Nanoarchaeota archaeon]
MPEEKIKDITKKIDSEFANGGVYPIDARNQKSPFEYVQKVESELEKKGYEILGRLKDPNREFYHIHLRRKE